LEFLGKGMVDQGEGLGERLRGWRCCTGLLKFIPC